MTTSALQDLRKSQRDSCAGYQLQERIDNLISNSTTPLTLSPTQSFPTLQDLAAHLKAAAKQRSFVLNSSFKNQQMRLICSRSYGTSYKSGYGTCKAYWEISDDDSLTGNAGGSWKVIKAKLKHDHEIDHLEVLEGEGDIGDASDSEDEVDMNFRLDGKSTSSSSSSGSIAKVLPISLPKRDKKPIVKTIRSSNKVQTVQEFRLHGSIRKEVEALLSSGQTLPFPTIANGIGFVYHDQFRLYTTAAAQQANFAVYLNNNTAGGANLETFFMRCTRNHSRTLVLQRCQFKITVGFKQKNDNDKSLVWKVVEENSHSSVCLKSIRGSSSGVNIESEEVESTKFLPISPPPVPSTSNTIKRPLSVDNQSSSSSKRIRLSSTTETLASSTSTSTSNLSSHQQLPSHPLTLPTPISLPPISSRPITISELSSFLYTLSPPLASHASLLHEYGINNTLAIMNLIISSSSETFNSFMDQLKDDGEIKLVQRIALREKLKDAREEVLDLMM